MIISGFLHVDAMMNTTRLPRIGNFALFTLVSSCVILFERINAIMNGYGGVGISFLSSLFCCCDFQI